MARLASLVLLVVALGCKPAEPARTPDPVERLDPAKASTAILTLRGADGTRSSPDDAEQTVASIALAGQGVASVSVRPDGMALVSYNPRKTDAAAIRARLTATPSWPLSTLEAVATHLEGCTANAIVHQRLLPEGGHVIEIALELPGPGDLPVSNLWAVVTPPEGLPLPKLVPRSTPAPGELAFLYRDGVVTTTGVQKTSPLRFDLELGADKRFSGATVKIEIAFDCGDKATKNAKLALDVPMRASAP